MPWPPAVNAACLLIVHWDDCVAAIPGLPDAPSEAARAMGVAVALGPGGKASRNGGFTVSDTVGGHQTVQRAYS